MCKCNKCGYTFHRPHGQIIKGIGCGVCSGRVLVKGLNDIPTTAPWMIPYFPGGIEEASNHTMGDGKKFTPICPFCGRLSDYQTTPNQIRTRHGISCICKDGVSMPNKVIRSVMEQSLRTGMISSYKTEYASHDKNGVMRKFDTLFTDLDGNQYFVEMDGGYHGSIIKKHRKNKILPLSAKLFLPDILKDELAEELGITMIRIDCYKSDIDYIKKNLYDSILSHIIDLDKIDWLEVEDYCFNNIMRQVCDYKNNHPEMLASEISNIFQITTPVIRKYLKRGTKLGLCNYNPHEESKRANVLKKYMSIQTYIKNLDTGQEWYFDSLKDFYDKSEQILDGKKMTKSMIEKRFNKTTNDYIIIETDKHRYLIQKIGGIGNGI